MTGTVSPIEGGDPTPRRAGLSNAVLGTLLFIVVEAMLFAGFISAFVVVKANYAPGAWPPPDQPRLPIEATAFSTLLLLASGVVLWRAGKRFDEGSGPVGPLLASAVALGSCFVGLQGFEWARLLAEGLTLQSHPFGAFFYVIVGTHALHAIPALIVLLWVWRRQAAGTLTADAFGASRLFWYFVVLVWPVVYWKVYL